MAEVNDLFIRSLRKSTSRRPSGGVEVGLAAGLSKHQAASWLTGRQSASGQSRPATGCGKSEDIRGDEMPPDLLANLTPRPQSGSPPFSRSDASEGGLTERILGRKAWNPFCNSVKKSTSAGLTPVVKEYRVQEQTARSRAGSTPLANHSALIQSQVRVVPTWFPPTNISRLKRQDSFHGETAASKQRAFRMECRTQREPSVPAETDSLSCTQMITEEPGMTAAASTPGVKKHSKPPKPEVAQPLPICPRHAKHHSISPIFLPKSPTSTVMEKVEVPGTSASAEVVKKLIETDLKSKKKPKSVFKFGTLPRSFKVSGTGRSSPALLRPPGSPSPVTYGEDPPKSAPPLLRRPAGGAARKSRNRNSWHVTVPLLRPDVALPEDKMWFDPLSVPSAQQKLCSCGDTRKHVHLVKFAPDLTLTDTRYFVGEKSQEDIPQSEIPSQISNQILNDSETDFDNHSDCPDEWGTIAADDFHEDEGQFEEANVAEVLDQALSSAHQEIEAISTQDKSMLRKLLDMSDQIRHWNGSRKHRIRSVDSSPIVSQLNLFSVGNKSLGSIPPLLGTSIKSIPEELHLPARTYSMENLYNPKGQVADNASLALRFAKDTSGDISASHLRTNMHLSYSDLLKNSSKFWQQPSQPGSFGATPELSSTMTVLREASLNLLL